MSALGHIRRPSRRMLLALIGLTLAIVATARAIDTSDGLVHGCYYIVATPQYRAGTLRIVEPGTSCPAGQQAPVSWRIAGDQGPAGIRGASGPAGLAGLRGPQGPAGQPGFRGPGGRSAPNLTVQRGPLGEVHVREQTFDSPTFIAGSANDPDPGFFEARCNAGEEPVAAGVSTGGDDRTIVPQILASYPDPSRHAWEVEVTHGYAKAGSPWSVRITITCWPGYPARPPIAHHLITGEKLIPLR